MTWLPWFLIGLVIGLLIGAFRQHRSMHSEILRLQEKVTAELSAHYITERRLIRRGRDLLALQKRIESMAEIAQSSAQLAQIYEGLLEDLRRAEQGPKD